jgi:benzodiazapine receptor
MKPNYVVIPLVTILTSVIGSQFTRGGMDWYRTIALPPWTPPGSVIGTVWTIIFVLATAAALIFWNGTPQARHLNVIVGLFLCNAALNVLWSYLFFARHLIGEAIIEMIALNLTTLLLILLLWRASKLASILLAPYFLWVCFAMHLASRILVMNGAVN